MFEWKKKSRLISASIEEISSLGFLEIIYRIRREVYKTISSKKTSMLSPGEVFNEFNLELKGLEKVKFFYLKDDYEGAQAELIKYMENRVTPRFFFDPDDMDRYSQLLNCFFQGEKEKTIQLAEDICQHKFSFLGTEFQFGDEINWSIEPVSGKSWPMVRWTKIAFQGPKSLGDVKLTWELNRHQYFLTLGRAYWYTKNEKYAEEVCRQLSSWIEKNPVEVGVNWISSLEIAVRSISWMWSYYFFLKSPSFTDMLHFEFIKSILANGLYLERNLPYSRNCLHNNHLISHAAGLALIALVFPELKRSEGWLKESMEILYSEIDNQIYPDGVDFEQAINYHRFVLYFYILVIRLSQMNGYNPPKKVLKKIEKMIDFILFVMKPDKSVPMIGDWDDGRAIVLNNDSVGDYTPTLSTGAVLFKRSDFKKGAARLNEETLWLYGEKGVRDFYSLPDGVCPASSGAFREAGYYIMREEAGTNDSYLLFRCGPHGGHGNADMLNIELYANGESFLVDPGTYTYNGDRQWRTYFRSTSAHNTVVVDGESQAIPHRVFKWLKVARHKLNNWCSAPGFDFVDGEHDGYARLSDPVIHRRRIFFVKPEYWIVWDLLTGEGEHTFENYFHFLPTRLELDLESKVCKTKKPGKPSLIIIPANTDSLDAEIIEGEISPIQGWISRNYGTKEKAPVLRYRKTTSTPTDFITLLLPCRIEDDVQIGLTQVSVKQDRSEASDTKAICLKIAIGCITDIYFSSIIRSIRHADNFIFDGENIFIRSVNPTGLQRIIIHNGKELILNGEIMVKADRPVEAIEAIWEKGTLRINLSDNASLKVFAPDVEVIYLNSAKTNYEREGPYALING